MAVCGVNVFVVLLTGIVFSGIIGIYSIEDYGFLTFSQHVYNGFASMNEIMILSMMLGGLGELIKQNRPPPFRKHSRYGFLRISGTYPLWRPAFACRFPIQNITYGNCRKQLVLHSSCSCRHLIHQLRVSQEQGLKVYIEIPLLLC